VTGDAGRSRPLFWLIATVELLVIVAAAVTHV